MTTPERDGGIPWALWVVLLLAALAGLGLLAKHYRITREGETPKGPFAVSPSRRTEDGSRRSASGAPDPPERGDDANRKSKNGLLRATVGDVDLVVAYGRPEVRGRTIWGGLVPYGEVWRTGADEATTITFSGPVEVEGEPVPHGTYALFTIPAPGEWTVILNEEAEQWGAFDYDPSKDRLRIRVEPEGATFTETMTFVALDDGIALRWGELEIPIRIDPAD